VRMGPDSRFVEVWGMPLQVLSALVDRVAGAVELTCSNRLIEPLRPRSLCASESILYCVASTDLSARFSRSAQVAVGALVEERPAGSRSTWGRGGTRIAQGTPERAVAPSQKGA
jgi:hypothetical protein